MSLPVRPPNRLTALLGPRGALPGPLRNAWRRTMLRLLPLGGSSEGNQVTLYVDGDDVFAAMVAAIARAQRFIWMESYIFEPDGVGRMFLDALAAAAARGVEVKLLVDAFGSPSLDETHVGQLVTSGGRFVLFNPPWHWAARLPRLIRDHRKIVVVDGEVGFAGGMNISEDYAGDRFGNGRFRDTHALLEGPCVRDLATVFAGSFFEATGERVVAPTPPLALQAGSWVQVLGSNVRRKRKHIQRALYHTIGRSLSRVWLTSPYFVPPPRLMAALARAARRGVDVRILTAGLSDVPIAKAAARHLYGSLLRAGVRLYEMNGRTLHAKTATIDGVWASVGSFNLDRWSFARNLEVNVTAVDPGLAGRLERCFEIDTRVAREVSLAEWEARSLWERVRGFLAFQIYRL